MQKPKHNSLTLTAIRRAVRAGRSIEEIANAAGYTPQGVRMIVRRAGYRVVTENKKTVKIVKVKP